MPFDAPAIANRETGETEHRPEAHSWADLPSFLAEARAPALASPAAGGLLRSGGSQGRPFLPGAGGMAVVTWAATSGPEPCGHVGMTMLGSVAAWFCFLLGDAPFHRARLAVDRLWR